MNDTHRVQEYADSASGSAKHALPQQGIDRQADGPSVSSLACGGECPDLHSLGGLASTADSTQIEASVSSITQLQLQVGALTHDHNFHGVQAIDLEWDLLSVQASFTGRENDADILACSRS